MARTKKIWIALETGNQLFHAHYEFELYGCKFYSTKNDLITSQQYSITEFSTGQMVPNSYGLTRKEAAEKAIKSLKANKANFQRAIKHCKILNQ